jgi:hypothetical protein
MKSGTESKLKFKQLQRRFDLALWQARGLLDTLWEFTKSNAPAGDIGRFTNEEIAIGLDWRDDPDRLADTLVELRWLDRHPGCRLIIHDWPEHCEDNVHKTLARKTEVFADGSLPKLARIPVNDRSAITAAYQQKFGKEAVEAGRTFTNAQERLEAFSSAPENAPALPCLALPSLAINAHAAASECTSGEGEKTQITDTSPVEPFKPPGGNNASTSDDPSDVKPTRHAYSQDFERWYAIYPVKAGKVRAAAAFGRALKRISQDKKLTRDQALDWLCKITGTYATSPKGMSGKYTGYPEGWLNGGHYDDDPATWSDGGPQVYQPPADPNRPPVNTFAPRRRTENT